jgi:hypothetical protein
VHQGVAKEIRDGDYELAGRKPQPSRQVGFKAKNDGTIDSGNIYLGDEGKQTAIQPTKVMVAMALSVRD